MMRRFVYAARKGVSETVRGTIDATGEKEALELLHARGLFPLTLKEDHAASHLMPRMSARAEKRLGEEAIRHVLLFAKARHDLVTAFSALVKKYAPQSPQRACVEAIVSRLQQGSLLSELLADSFPSLSSLIPTLVRTGESAGDIVPALEAAVGIIEREYILKDRLASAMAYPAVLASAGVASGFAIILFVVPRLRPALEKTGAHGFTLFLFFLSDLFRTPMGWCLFAAVILTIAWMAIRWWHIVASVFPPYARFVVARDEYSAIAGLRLLVEAKIPLADALAALATAERAPKRRSALASIALGLSRGGSLADIAGENNVFGAFFASMAGAGYASGSLPEALRSAEDEVRARMERSLSVLCALAEPMILLAVGAGVGGAVVALMVPLMDATQRVY